MVDSRTALNKSLETAACLIGDKLVPLIVRWERHLHRREPAWPCCLALVLVYAWLAEVLGSEEITGRDVAEHGSSAYPDLLLARVDHQRPGQERHEPRLSKAARGA